VSKGSFEPYLPRLVRDWSLDGDAGPVRELEGTLVSVDISGFTRLSERLQTKGRAGAEELVLLISGVFLGLIGISDRHGGDVLKFRGDALLLLFDGAGHERRACHAASHMQWLIGATGKTMSSVGSVTLRMSTGIYSGPCHFFVLEGTHRELVIAGPAATATIKLESEASAGQIIVSRRTAEALEPSWVGQAREHGHFLRRLDLEDEPDVVAHLAAEAASAGDELADFIPAPLRAHLRLEGGEAEHRQVTAAFLKYTGVDALLERGGAEAVGEQLQEVATLVSGATAEVGLTWLESDIDVDGGKLYLVGGAPSSTGADEAGMLRLLRSVLDARPALALRAGVNRGPAFCGDVGAESRRTYAVMGDTVNLAARLAGRAAAGEILATADVLDRSSTRYESEAQPFLMKGKERAVTAYRVGAATGTREDEPASELPLIGRETELAALAEAVNASRLREQRLVELVGEPGIGKSRLVEELKRQALGFTQLVARCDPYASSTPYFVFRSLLRPLAGITPELSPEEAGAQLTPWIAAVMPDLAQWLPLLAIPFGAEVAPTPETEAIDPTFRRERLQDAVEQFVTRVMMLPTLVIVEDTHWIDDASRELIRHLTRAPAPRPWLLCVTRRPQGVELARDIAGHARLTLGPLEGAAAESLALAAAGELALPDEALAAVRQRSGGNPLFVRELVAAAREAGTADALPETVETLITARIDTLSPEDRFLLRNAAVLGARVELDVLVEVLGDKLEDIADLARWERLGEFVVWEDAGELRFIHDLFRTAAYEGLSFRRRREMHARIGASLERRQENPALLSLHFSRAEDHQRTWRYAAEAGRRAQAEHANVDGAELYARALGAAAELELPPAEVAEVAEALGDVDELAGRYDEAAVAYAQARKLAPHARLLLKEGVLRERFGKYEEALRWFGRGLKEADDATKTELEIAYAGVLFRQGRYDDAISWLERAADRAREAGQRESLAHAYFLLDAAQTHLGTFDQTWCNQALAIYEELDDPKGIGAVLNNLGIHAYYAGRWDDSLAYYRHSREAKERSGDIIYAALAMNNEAEILSDQGKFESAEALFTEALRVCRAAAYVLGEEFITANLGRLAARTGRFADAHERLDRAGAKLHEVGSEGLALEVDARRAECFVFEGRYREAAKAAESTLAQAAALGRTASLGSLLERLLGYALHQARQPAKARPHFEESLRLAREAKAEYEVALTLRALAETGAPEHAAEAAEIFERLGVVSTPKVPLP
jgi:class 3 adenylate cyclase/tetratricopeptide (TPR) repeat protein